ncbi:MAG: acetoacetate decarboxylase family protein [Deltaproteobacteria bacterium]|nr:acetoacetate decarboxylase family protein [Deltaproteobacteria bacterium]MBN2846628.1 acetoacetate decarboxylase family protein [Deltaproteobacteria bacterium]
MRKPKKDNFFDGVLKRINKEFNVPLPIFYYDCTSMTAIFTASARRLRSHLPSEEMHPVEVFPGICLIALSAFEYRSCDIGPYNEFSIAAPITYQKKGIPGLTMMYQLLRNTPKAFIFFLPVTSELAMQGGVTLGGYPKFIADIELRKENTFITCNVSEHGTPILSLQGKWLTTAPGPVSRTVIYTKKNGNVLMANLYTNPIQFSQSFRSSSARLTMSGNHEMCTFLRDVKISSKPMAYQFSPKFESMLFDSKNIIDV